MGKTEVTPDFITRVEKAFEAAYRVDGYNVTVHLVPKKEKEEKSD